LTKIKPYQWVVIIVLGIVARMGYLRSHGYTWIDSGFEGKTIWNWLELLIIPGTLAVVAIILDNRERKADRELTRDNQREAALQNYFDVMTRLILDKGLKKPDSEDDVRDIARVKTLTTLERLDSSRKSKLVIFLCEGSLVTSGKGTQPIINLGGANLRRANLWRANLEGVELGRAHLDDAVLGYANLKSANLKCAYLEGTRLDGAVLRQACLEDADLGRANLSSADLEDADLEGANLKCAYLAYAKLKGANLRGAYLEGANLEGADLEGAYMEFATLEGATMPDGNKYDPAIHTIEKLTALNPQET
jgi:hypothetical protein